MTPQLFINYKLKSVAHLPWKVFMYKALNTFIDDLFAFIIKMPTLHRLSCLRDDIVFIIYLYQVCCLVYVILTLICTFNFQRWIYPIDKKRVNEFGQVFDEQTRQELQRQEQEQQGPQGSIEQRAPDNDIVPETDVRAKKTE
jgi:hypothetical protein